MTPAEEDLMQVLMMIAAATGCTLMALLFAKAPGEGDWQGAVMTTLFAGIAGALVALAVT